MSTAAHGIMFHHFHRPGERAGQGSITAEELAEVIDSVGRERLLPAQEWFERAVKGKLKKDDLCITFDDNLKCQYDVARPVLENLGLTAFFFIYSSVCMGMLGEMEIHRVFRTTAFEVLDDFYQAFERTARQYLSQASLILLQAFHPENYLTQYPFYSAQDKRFRFIRDEILGPQGYAQVMDQMIAEHGLQKEALANDLWMQDAHLRSLSEQGHMIGLHSFSHPTRLSLLPTMAQINEYQKNYEHIASVTGKPPVAMSHPCNSYDGSTLAGLFAMGIKVGFCSNMEDIPGRGPLQYPRQDHSNILQKMRA